MSQSESPQAGSSSPSSAAPFVLVGGGLAATRAIEGLRAEGRDEKIVLVGREQALPYDRPPLSKAVLIGSEQSSSTTLHDEAWFADRGVELMLGYQVTRLDLGHRRVHLGEGSALSYSGLLLATGSTPRRLDLPGAALDGVLTLRSDLDAGALFERLATGEPVVIVGGGWIGLEVAAAARSHGCPTTVIEPQATPLFGVLGPEIGGLLQRVHESHGVVFRLGGQVQSITGDSSRRVTGVVVDGQTLPASTVVVGIGITPNVQLAAEAGLAVSDGIVCDSHLRTSVDHVLAAGDVANWYNPTLDLRLRVDHWTNANVGGKVAGRSLAGADVAHDSLPVFFSDQYDLGLEYVGWVPRGVHAHVVLRGDPESGSYQAFWLDGTKPLAAMHVNQFGSLDDLTQVVHMQSVDATRLADADVPLAAAAHSADELYARRAINREIWEGGPVYAEK